MTGFFKKFCYVTSLTICFIGSVLPAYALDLNQDCIVNVLNRTVQVSADGGWSMPNVPSFMGQIRARATCVRDGQTHSGQTEFFTIERNGVVRSSNFNFEAGDPPPSSLTVNPAGTVQINGAGTTAELSVIATYPGASTKDVTTATSGINYTSTNPEIVSVDADGMVTALASGTVLITARLDGTVKIKRVIATASGDTDGDGLPDDLELINGLNPNDPVDAMEDPDGDGLTNKDELLIYGTAIRDADSDDDTITDGEEVVAGADGFVTSPLLVDTDGDEIWDGLEIATGSDPTDSASFNLADALIEIQTVPEFLTLTVNTVIGEAGEQLTTTGTLMDGNPIDLTSTSKETNYSSSDLFVCSFGVPDGKVFGSDEGSCTVTVSNNGFTDTVTATVDTFVPVALSFIAIPGFAYNVDVKGNTAFVASGAAGLQVVDVADRSTPVIIGSLDTAGNSFDIKVVGDTAYIADGSTGLQLVDVSNLTSPALKGVANTPGSAQDVVVNGNLAFVADGSAGLQIVDVSDLNDPVIIGSLALPSNAVGIDVSADRTLAVVALGNSGIQLVDVSNPFSPIALGNVDTGSAADVVLKDNYALVADGQSSLTSVDLSDTDNPVVSASTPRGQGGLLTDVALAGRFVFGADIFFVNGVPIVDVQQPATPIPRAILNFAGFRDDNGIGIVVDGSYVYLTAAVGSNSRLYIGQYLQVADNAGIPPTAAITSPLVGTTVLESSAVPVVVEANDDVAVALVEFLIDGSIVASDTNPPYQANMTVPSGITELTIGASARDLGGNLGIADNILINVIPDPLTTLIGRVVDDTQLPVQDVLVETSGGLSASTDSSGEFEINGVPTISETVSVTVSVTIEGKLFSGRSKSFLPIRGGITDVGSVTLSSFSFEGLLAYYPFNGNAIDESDNGRDATVLGATLTTDRHGNSESAYSFDGNDWIRASSDGLPSGERTVAFWFNTPSLPSSRPFPVPFSYGGGSSCGTTWFQDMSQTSLNVHRHCGISPVLCTINSVPVGQWTHWATTTSTTGTKTYLNGIEVCNSPTFISNTNVAGKQLSIGVSVWFHGLGPYTDRNISYFSGSVDDVVVYDRALSLDEIGVLFAQ